MYESMATLLREARIRSGLTQRDLAAELSVNQQSVSRWERGLSRPRRPMVHRLAHVLGIRDPEQLARAAGYPESRADQRLPSRPLVARLPLAALSPADFEGFCRDLVRFLHPGTTPSRFGDQGHTQDGIDLLAQTIDGRTLAFQCKRVKQFGAARVRAAVADTTFPADHHHLLLSRTASPDARIEMGKHEGWSLWDVEDISSKVRLEIPVESARRLVDTYFPGWRRDFLGIEEPGVWLTPDEFFRPFLRANAALSHAWTLVGRTADLADATRLLDTEGVVVVVGRGGAGKTRFLRQFADVLTNENPRGLVRFVAPDTPFNAVDVERLTAERNVVIVDDAHDRDDIELLLGVLARHERDVRIVLATRPYGVAKLEAQLRDAGLLLDMLAGVRVELQNLTLDDLTALVAEVLRARDVPVDAAAEIAKATQDCPLFTVIGADLVARERLDPRLIATDAKTRRLVFDAFRDAILGGVGDPLDRATLRELLTLVALVQPVLPDENPFRHAAEAILQRPADVVARHVRTLEEAGVLLRRGRSLRVVPDLLADFLIADACVDPRTGAPTGYADRVFAAGTDDVALHVIVNLAKLDWLIGKTQPMPSTVLDRVWASLAKDLLEADIFGRATLLRSLADVSFYQPDRALRLAHTMVQNPTTEGGGPQSLLLYDDIGYEHVLNELPAFVRGAGYHIDHIGDVADFLWELGRAEPRPLPSNPGHAIRVLQDLAKIEPRKPLAFCDRILARAINWLADDALGTYTHSPFDVMEAALAREGYTTESRKWQLTMKPYYIPVSQVLRLRDKVLAAAIEHLCHPDPRVAVRAAECIEHGLRGPSGLFGDEVPPDLDAEWNTENVRVLGLLADALGQRAPDPVVQERLRQAIWWHQRHGGEAVRAAARSVIAELGHGFAERLTEVLSHGWEARFRADEDDEDEDDDQHDYASSVERWRERQRRVAEELLAAYPDPAAAVDMLEERLAAVHRAAESDSPSGPFLDVLFDISAAVTDEVVRRIRTCPDGVWAPYLSGALSAVRLQDRGAALVLAREFLDPTDNKAFASHVAAAWGWAAQREPLDESEIGLLRELARHADRDVRRQLARSLRFASAIDAQRRVNLLLSVVIDGDGAIAKEVVGAFSPHSDLSAEHLTPEQLSRLLKNLVSCDDIGDYQIGAFLGTVSERDPESVVDLLRERIDHSPLRTDGRYTAIPYAWDEDSPLAVRKSPRFHDLFRELCDWAAAPTDDDNWQKDFWAPHLFAAVVTTFDDDVVAAFDQWVRPAHASRLRTLGRLIREAPARVVWDHIPWVVDTLEMADRFDRDTYLAVANGFHAAVVSGVRSGVPGQPFPEDIDQRDKSTSIARTLPPGTAARRFFEDLARSAENSIRWTVERDEADELH